MFHVQTQLSLFPKNQKPLKQVCDTNCYILASWRLWIVTVINVLCGHFGKQQSIPQELDIYSQSITANEDPVGHSEKDSWDVVAYVYVIRKKLWTDLIWWVI